MTQKDFTPPNGESTRNGRSEQGGLLDEAKNVASHLATEAKDEASSRVSSQKDRAAKSLSSVADALRGTKDELDGSIPAMGQYADKAADTVEQLSEYIRSKNVGELVDTVERFARRESALFLGGTAVLGLLAGRFLRSSRPGGGVRDGVRDNGYDRDYRSNYDRAGRDFGGSAGNMNERSRSGYGSNLPVGGKIGGTNNNMGSGGMGSTGMGTKPNVGQPGQPGQPSSSNIGVQKVGSSSSPPAGQAAPREATKPGGFTPSTGQSSNFEGSTGAGPATGSNVPPKKGPEVK